MLLEVLSAKYIGGYKIFVVFNNGYKTTIDLEDTIKNETRPIFQPLQNTAYFKTLSVKLSRCQSEVCGEKDSPRSQSQR